MRSVTLLLAGVVAAGACSPSDGDRTDDASRCLEVGAGTVQALDFSPDGRWLALNVRRGGQELEILRLHREDGRIESVDRASGIIDYGVTVGNDGTAYYQQLDPSTAIVRGSPGHRETFEAVGTGYINLEWSTSGLLGNRDWNIFAPGTPVASLRLDDGRVTEQDIVDVGLVDALAVTPAGDFIATARSLGPGRPTEISFIADGAVTHRSILPDADPLELALVTGDGRLGAAYMTLGTSDIWILFPDTGETRLLLVPEFLPLALAGDGGELLAYSSRTGTGQAGRVCIARVGA